MDVKFTVVSRALFNSVEHSDGQIIAIWDEPGLYYEMNGTQYSVLGMQFETVTQKPTTSSVSGANDHTFYFYNSTSDDGGLYVFNGTSFVKLSHPTGYKVRIDNLGSTSKMYLTGTTSTSTSPAQEYRNTSVYVQNGTTVTLVAPKFQGDLDGTADKATKDANNNNITSYVKTIQAVSGTNNVQFLDGAGTVLFTIDTTDTKNTAGSTNTSDKIYLIGAKTQGNNPQTYSNSTVYTQNGELYSNGLQVANTINTITFENKTINLSDTTITVLETFGYDRTTRY